MLTSYPTVPSFLAAAQPFLEERELDNNMILGLCAGVEGLPPDWTLLTVERDGAVDAVAMKFGGRLMLAETQNPDAYRLFADYFKQNGVHPHYVFAPTPATIAFAERYAVPEVEPRRACIAHELRVVQPVAMPRGSFELATPEHYDRLVEWIMIFEEEAQLPGRQPENVVRAQVVDRVARQNFFLWTVGGKLVSMAAVMRATPHIAIVGLVYTPPEHRGHGYATGITAALSTTLLGRGYRACGLFTDADNPTSNHIYRKIGYEPGSEFLEVVWKH